MLEGHPDPLVVRESLTTRALEGLPDPHVRLSYYSHRSPTGSQTIVGRHLRPICWSVKEITHLLSHRAKSKSCSPHPMSRMIRDSNRPNLPLMPSRVGLMMWLMLSHCFGLVVFASTS